MKNYKWPTNLKTFSASHVLRNLKESDKEIQIFIYRTGEDVFENTQYLPVGNRPTQTLFW